MAKNKVLEEGALHAGTRKIINDNFIDRSYCTTEFDVDSGTTGATLANVAGMITETLQPGTYKVRIHLDMLSTANGGLKAALKFGTGNRPVLWHSSTRSYGA